MIGYIKKFINSDFSKPLDKMIDDVNVNLTGIITERETDIGILNRKSELTMTHVSSVYSLVRGLMYMTTGDDCFYAISTLSNGNVIIGGFLFNSELPCIAVPNPSKNAMRLCYNNKKIMSFGVLNPTSTTKGGYIYLVNSSGLAMDQVVEISLPTIRNGVIRAVMDDSYIYAFLSTSDQNDGSLVKYDIDNLEERVRTASYRVSGSIVPIAYKEYIFCNDTYGLKILQRRLKSNLTIDKSLNIPLISTVMKLVNDKIAVAGQGSSSLQCHIYIVDPETLIIEKTIIIPKSGDIGLDQVKDIFYMDKLELNIVITDGGNDKDSRVIVYNKSFDNVISISSIPSGALNICVKDDGLYYTMGGLLAMMKFEYVDKFIKE